MVEKASLYISIEPWHNNFFEAIEGPKHLGARVSPPCSIAERTQAEKAFPLTVRVTSF